MFYYVVYNKRHRGKQIFVGTVRENVEGKREELMERDDVYDVNPVLEGTFLEVFDFDDFNVGR